jgi:hypothetical protein
LRKLETLNLRNRGIKDAGVACLKDLTQVKQMVLDGDPITYDAIYRLPGSQPDTMIGVQPRLGPDSANIVQRNIFTLASPI